MCNDSTDYPPAFPTESTLGEPRRDLDLNTSRRETKPCVTLSHIGEYVVAELANRDPRQFIKALYRNDKWNHAAAEVDWQHIQSVHPFAYPHAQLTSSQGIPFDGQHQVDLVLWVNAESAMALELKLGLSGLTATTFNKNFLNPAAPPKRGSRVTGSVMSFLDRRPGYVSVDEELYVKFEDERKEKRVIKLSHEWGLVVQQSVFKKWTKCKPDLSQNALCTSIQEIVSDCGGKPSFNELVHDLVNFDFFDSWHLGIG